MTVKTEVVACRECGERDQANFMDPTRSRMLTQQLCFTCLFWTDKVAKSVDPLTARIDGRHYQIGPEAASPRDQRGFDGARAVIRFADAREVTTTNLWFQGEIPAHFRARLPNNATFLEHP